MSFVVVALETSLESSRNVYVTKKVLDSAILTKSMYLSINYLIFIDHWRVWSDEMKAFVALSNSVLDILLNAKTSSSGILIK